MTKWAKTSGNIKMRKRNIAMLARRSDCCNCSNIPSCSMTVLRRYYPYEDCRDEFDFSDIIGTNIGNGTTNRAWFVIITRGYMTHNDPVYGGLELSARFCSYLYKMGSINSNGILLGTISNTNAFKEYKGTDPGCNCANSPGSTIIKPWTNCPYEWIGQDLWECPPASQPPISLGKYWGCNCNLANKAELWIMEWSNTSNPCAFCTFVVNAPSCNTDSGTIIYVHPSELTSYKSPPCGPGAAGGCQV